MLKYTYIYIVKTFITYLQQEWWERVDIAIEFKNKRNGKKWKLK